ncbi:acetylornithine/succinyldiaminopimelate transaminase [Ectopseudomonas oleovorans]|uniref:Acetylornithine aminotransferase n=1 Tax=Ectopseudomonas oleovorans (strain CECT 5344) TaxID=1182590 RepID=W6QU95_ECTO5|nr:acetylornithine/succinyldiaminopimelate transaminase [Pseudomonas oleovorans]CDM40480.1 acetylornithine delta-aminotransferase / N-succinyldiaminopimelate aminotransferase [Pseudomonas oleovorans CECT 5344]CDR91110.1 acetylornithine delta-aminotransferase / N-succinyldiaminopimelate aminotransferase [Pseudomonas oleovorans]
MNAAVSRDLYEHVMVPNYAPVSVVPVDGRGARVWDQDGTEYIDFAGGIAVNALGHCHPDLVEALTLQAQRLWHTSNIFANEPAMRLAHALTQASFADRVFFANSGAEANEAAFKLARRYGVRTGGEDKHEIVANLNSFHGRSLFTVSVAGQPKYSEGFGPPITGIRHVAFNDIKALEAAVSSRTCAVVIEPVQGESGVLPASRAYLQRARELCNEHGALLIFDEVQTGMGRLGTLFGYEHFDVVPDVMTLAKAIGCGFPLAAMLATKDAARHLELGTHGSTFGGSPLACAVGETALKLIDRPELLRGVQIRHTHFVSALTVIGKRYDLFKEVRGIGLLLGCVLTDRWKGQAKHVIDCCLEHGVMVLQAGPDVIRLAPSLVIETEEIDEGLARLAKAVKQLSREPVAM